MNPKDRDEPATPDEASPSIHAAVPELCETDTCPKCGGERRILRVLRTQIPICQPCNARREAEQRREEAAEQLRQELLNPLWKRVGVPERYKDASMERCIDLRAHGMPGREHWGDGYYFATTDAEVDVIRQLLRLSSTRGWGLLSGTAGWGKSHLAAAWLLDLARAGRSCAWISEREVWRLYSSSFESHDRRTGEHLVKRACETPVIVWDDFGYSANIKLLGQIVGIRYERDLTTLLTSNLQPGKPSRERRSSGRERYLEGLLDSPSLGRLMEQTRAESGGFRIHLALPDRRAVPDPSESEPGR